MATSFRDSLDLLAPFGRIVVAGFASYQLRWWNPLCRGGARGATCREPTWRGLAIASRGVLASHIGYLFKDPERVRRVWNELTTFVTDHAIRPVVGATFAFERDRRRPSVHGVAPQHRQDRRARAAIADPFHAVHAALEGLDNYGRSSTFAPVPPGFSLQQLLHGAVGLVDRRVGVGARRGVGVGDGDAAEGLATDDVGPVVGAVEGPPKRDRRGCCRCTRSRAASG